MLVFLIFVLQLQAPAHLPGTGSRLFNIFFKRESDGGTALGAMKPLTSGGKAITLDDIEDLDEDSKLGVGVDRGLLLEGHPRLRDLHRVRPLPVAVPRVEHREAALPQAADDGPARPRLCEGAVPADEGKRERPARGRRGRRREVERPLGSGHRATTGSTSPRVPATSSTRTSCGPADLVRRLRPAVPRRHRARRPHHRHAPLPGARRVQLPGRAQRAVQGPGEQGQPVEHVAHRADGLGQGPDVRRPGRRRGPRVAGRRSTGCSGSAAPAPTRTAPRRPPAPSPSCSTWPASRFAVLGNGETCTGDPARRAGNEFVFQGLAHAERRDLQGVQGQEGRLDLRALLQHAEERVQGLRHRARGRAPHPAAQPARARGQADPDRPTVPAPRSARSPTTTRATSAATTRSTPRRASCCEILPGAEFKEMERNSEKSFCCGAGGARMWMEENIGERINVNRTKEAVGTGADQIAVGCPFCRVMLADGLTAEQAAGNAREEVEVLDVAQMLLASVKGESATKVPVRRRRECVLRYGDGRATAATDVATKAEPEAGDVTITEDTITDTADAGPAAKASGGTSLFDTPAPAAPAPSSGSLFDTPAPEAPAPAPASGSLFDTPAPEAPAPAPASGSLFDTPAPEAPAPAPAAPSSGSLFDTPAPEAPSPAPTSGSLFDIAAPAPAAAPASPASTTSDDAAAPATESSDVRSRPSRSPSPTSARAGRCSTSPPRPRLPASPASTTSDDAAAPATESSDVPESTEPEPVADLGSGGSLFDIAAPAPAPAPAPAEPRLHNVRRCGCPGDRRSRQHARRRRSPRACRCSTWPPRPRQPRPRRLRQPRPSRRRTPRPSRIRRPTPRPATRRRSSTPTTRRRPPSRTPTRRARAEHAPEAGGRRRTHAEDRRRHQQAGFALRPLTHRLDKIGPEAPRTCVELQGRSSFPADFSTHSWSFSPAANPTSP